MGEWKINLVVQPDLFAAKVDNAATVTAATNPDAIAAVNTVTGTSHGTLAKANFAAADITEVAIKLSTATATGGKEQLTLSGTTDVGGYVYCGVSKTASARMLADTTATKTTTTDATKTATTDATKTATTDATATTATTTTATPAVAK